MKRYQKYVFWALGLVVVLLLVSALFSDHVVSRFVAGKVWWQLRSVDTAYVVPTEREIAYSNPVEFESYSYTGLSFEAPVAQSVAEDEPGTTIIRFRSDPPSLLAVYKDSALALHDSLLDGTAGQVLTDPERDALYERVSERTNFGFYQYTLSLTPDQLSFFDSNAELVSASILLARKATIINGSEIWLFQNQHGVRGYVSPVEGGYHVVLFSKDDKVRELVLSGTPESVLMQVIGTVRF